MASDKQELIEALTLAVRALILQEVRLLRLGRAFSSPFVTREMNESIREAKGRVIALVRSMDPKERNLLIQRIVHQSVDEEIDLAVEARRNRCLRCIHIRYFDETGRLHVHLPLGTGRAQDIGCQMDPPAPGTRCEHFRERSRDVSLESYLNEMSFFYEVKEMFERLDEIWDYFINK